MSKPGKCAAFLSRCLTLAIFAVSPWVHANETNPSAGSLSDAEQRGSYIAKAGNCLACHTTDTGAPYAGGVPFFTDFGIIYSTNITPDPDAGIGDWTEADFLRAMQEGVSADGTHLYPAFPYPSFTKTTNSDLKDLYAFMQTVAPSSNTIPENEMGFPFDQRALMTVWKALFFEEGRFTAEETQSDQWNRGAYLVEGLGHCGTCHTPRNFLGGKQDALALSGGTYNDHVTDDKVRPWAAVNLTTAPDGLGSWTSENIFDYLKTGHSPKAGSFGPMNEVIELSTSQLVNEDIEAIALYLSSLPPVQRSSKFEMSSADFQAAEILYSIHCGTCHLPSGTGDPTTGPPLVGSSIVQAEDPAALINVIIYGAQVPQSLPPLIWKDMKPLGEKLDDDEIALLSTYLRSNWNNLGGPVTASDVAQQR